MGWSDNSLSDCIAALNAYKVSDWPPDGMFVCDEDGTLIYSGHFIIICV